MSGADSGGGGDGAAAPDRIAQLMEYLNDPTLDTLPDHLKYKYKDGWDPEHLEEELQQHPFFMTETPDPSKPLPPLIEAFQQLKYSDTENSPHELALNHKEDGMFHFKIKKYRIAATCFTTAISWEMKEEKRDRKLLATLYNNRSACMWFIKNYRSCVTDCSKALHMDPYYYKALKRALASLEKLERWAEIVEWCDKWEELYYSDSSMMKVFSDSRRAARLGDIKDKARARRIEKTDADAKLQNDRIMAVIKDRGYKLRNEQFLHSSVAVDEGKVVKLDGNGVLHWPVLFMYPQYGQTDLVEQFSEQHSFSVHLEEMLDKDPPSWDRDGEYRSSTVEVWYLGDKFIQVNAQATLQEVMQEQYYWIPSNGVPSFFILSKHNQFCADFKDRIDVEGGL